MIDSYIDFLTYVYKNDIFVLEGDMFSLQRRLINT